MAEVYVDEKIQDYVIDLVTATRDPERVGLPIRHFIAYGASPRATIFLVEAARAHALLDGRTYVTPEDVKAIALDVLRHRIHVTYEAEAEETSGEEIARRVLEKVRVP
jgi:MoxR-like ATPase